MDVFETITALVSTLGYPVFEPFSSSANNQTPFYCRSRGADARGELVEDGFVVREGSKCRMDLTPSAPESLKSLRHQFLEGGVITEENGMFVFAQDYLFKSPSVAAAFVLGASANGWSEWKDKDGGTLSEVYRDEEPDESSEG